MTKEKFNGENWKSLTFDFEYSNKMEIKVSNFGRVCSFNVSEEGRILNSSLINGYPVIKLKFFVEKDPKVELQLENLKNQVPKLVKKIKELSQDLEQNQHTIEEKKALLKALKLKITKKYQKDLNERTINYSLLIHRAVASVFCKKPSDNHIFVAHLDYNKENNKIHNLKWMTKEENILHQKNSPAVIASKETRKKNPTKTAKLTITRVMLLKKQLALGKPMPYLVKAFKVTETQIYRIKRGENWGDIPAAT